MRILLSAAALAMVAVGTPATAQVFVKGHIRKDGTYVPPHVRTKPNSTIYDNYSTRPNYNPYTGRQGTVDPTPSYPVYRSRRTPPESESPLPESTQQRWRETMPLTCKYSDIC